MMAVELIKSTVSQAVKNLYGINEVNVFVEHPDNAKWGDYSTNVSMTLAKIVKQSPMEIAKNLCYEMSDIMLDFQVNDRNYPIFQKIDIASPGFINFELSKEWLYNLLYLTSTHDGDYKLGVKPTSKKVSLEHSNVNPNKAAHIGHLRNACIGQFIEKIYEYIGYDVNVQYYSNNLGVQVATSAMGMNTIKGISPADYKKFDHFAWDVYSRMESYINSDPKFKEERNSLLLKLEDTKSKEFISQKALADKILVEQLKTFHSLDIDYDVIIYESDIISLKFWEKAFEKLKNNPNVYFSTEGESKGCWLVKMQKTSGSGDKDKKKEGIEEDKIIVRSNGVPTYTGKDIAYHMWKYGLLGEDFKYVPFKQTEQEKALWCTTSEPADKSFENTTTFTNADMVLDVIGGEQTYAIEVVRQALMYLGYTKQAESMKHVNYGFVYLSINTAERLGIDVSDGKHKYEMSGRKGWGVKIDDLIDMVDGRLISDYGDYPALNDVRNGAIKFEMLKYNTFQDLVFDLESALNMKGYSGPYLQYTHARANSILEKSQYQPNEEIKQYGIEFITKYVMNNRESDVLRSIYKFPEVVLRSAEDFSPNTLCTFLFELAQRYNAFYSDMPILGEKDPNVKDFRLLLTYSVREVMKTGLYLLGIKAPNKM